MLFSPTLIFTFAGLLLLFWLLSLPNRIQRLTTLALESNEVEPLLKELQQRPEELRSKSFDQMMALLWRQEAYDLAAQFASAFVTQEPSLPRGHRWIERIINEQPEVAKSAFDPTFLNEQYNPHMAAHCGPGG